MEVVVATHNRDKFKEIKKVFENTDFTFEFREDLPDVVEDGETLIENALKKAREICKYTKKITIADDTGLEVRALDNRPGVYSARYAGEDATYQDNVNKMLDEMKDKEDRYAEFKTVAAIVFPDGREAIGIGVVEGEITKEEIGENGFGYDPIFYVTESKKTYAQMDVEEKNRVSHRAKAFNELLKILEENI